MTKARRGLGRGLGALIPTAAEYGPARPEPESPLRSDRPSDMFFERTDENGAAVVAAPALAAADWSDDAADPMVGTPMVGTDVQADDLPLADVALAELALADLESADPAAEKQDPGLLAAVDMAAPAPVGGQVDEVEYDGSNPDLAPVPGAVLQEIPIGDVRANPRQPRAVFDDEALDQLTHSVREFGVLQPVVVRVVTDGFELVMGERRLRAAAAAGLNTIPAIVRDTADDAMLRDALLENIHRAQLNPLEEAAAYQQLLTEFGVTHEQLASRIGRSRSQVTNTVRLMNLPVPVQRRVAAGVLSAGHARALLSLEDADAQDDLATRIVAEGLSVRATEELVATTARNAVGGRLPVRRSSRRTTVPDAGDLADRLSDVFDTRVRIDMGQRKGKMTIEFATLDDLDRIVEVMVPSLMSSRRTTGDDSAGATESGSESTDS